MLYVNANGARIPALGLGTWELRDDVARKTIEHALDVGYRHIDTAQMYANEAPIGEVLHNATVPREELFVTTKIWPENFTDGVLQKKTEESLNRLRLDSVDLLLLHWPNPQIDLGETLRALAEVKRNGLARHIGISNFTTALIEQATALCDEPLVLNQVEYHPYLSQQTVLAALRAHGMGLTAYCPIAKGAVFDDPVIRDIGTRHRKNSAQVALRWLIQQEGVIAIPRSSKPTNVEGNFALFDFALDETEMAAIGARAKPDGRLVDPAGIAPDWN